MIGIVILSRDKIYFNKLDSLELILDKEKYSSFDPIFDAYGFEIGFYDWIISDNNLVGISVYLNKEHFDELTNQFPNYFPESGNQIYSFIWGNNPIIQAFCTCSSLRLDLNS